MGTALVTIPVINPRTGEAVEVRGKAAPFFKSGKELRERLNASDEA